MKCDELKDYDYDPDFPFQSRGRFYEADEVEAAIAELKAESNRLKAIPEEIMKEVLMHYRDVACPNCGTVYGVGYSDVPHSVEIIHRICDTCMMPIEVKNPWNEEKK